MYRNKINIAVDVYLLYPLPPYCQSKLLDKSFGVQKFFCPKNFVGQVEVLEG